jgi:hypothetical protein
MPAHSDEVCTDFGAYALKSPLLQLCWWRQSSLQNTDAALPPEKILVHLVIKYHAAVCVDFHILYASSAYN